MSDKDLFDAIQSRDLAKVSEMIRQQAPVEIAKCAFCGSFAIQSITPSGRYECHCFNEFSTETQDCGETGPSCETSEESILKWNEQQAAHIDLRARLSLEQRSEPRERGWEMIDEDSGLPTQGEI